eukprot:682518-Rhodomonas_salina.5
MAGSADRFQKIREYLCEMHKGSLKMCSQPPPADRDERIYRRERSLGLLGLAFEEPPALLTSLVRPSQKQVQVVFAIGLLVLALIALSRILRRWRRGEAEGSGPSMA